jgi:hypothetical protein
MAEGVEFAEDINSAFSALFESERFSSSTEAAGFSPSLAGVKGRPLHGCEKRPDGGAAEAGPEPRPYPAQLVETVSNALIVIRFSPGSLISSPRT